MYFRIAKNNVVKSFKDYTIYFLTLAIAVCIFYTFNSIQAQESVFNLNSEAKLYMNIIQKILSFISVFVSIILAVLMLYANNFLIKRRKKELAIYITLGMKKKKVSKILLLETIIVGIISLIIGIIIGICLSQVLLIFTAKLFAFKINTFKFIISEFSIFKTIIYFLIIYFLIIIFNIRVISKYSLLDLITAERKNEKLKIKNPAMSFLINIIGIIILIISYAIVILYGLKSTQLKLGLILSFIGTFLFFIGLSGVLAFISNKNEKFYYKNLNTFIIKQINSKINTNIISITLISIILFLTIIGFVSGISYKITTHSDIEQRMESMVNIYIGIYLGCIFLITAVSILALQQLADASDNIKKYIALKKIGVNDRMINQVVFKQLIIYFMTPFIMAIINSIIFIYSANKSIVNTGQSGILGIATYTLIAIIVVYILYFYLTFVSIKNIINKNK